MWNHCGQLCRSQFPIADLFPMGGLEARLGRRPDRYRALSPGTAPSNVTTARQEITCISCGYISPTDRECRNLAQPPRGGSESALDRVDDCLLSALRSPCENRGVGRLRRPGGHVRRLGSLNSSAAAAQPAADLLYRIGAHQADGSRFAWGCRLTAAVAQALAL